MYEAFTAATWLAAVTDRLRLGHLVLCDQFRHPAVLARQAVTLDHLSGGRFELGIGSGSTPAELAAFGFPSADGTQRLGRLRETLELVTRFWTGEPVEYRGSYFQVEGARQLPVPLSRIPVVVGGTGPATMELVARYADWWNVPMHQLDRLASARPAAGRARVSAQVLITLVPDPPAGTRWSSWPPGVSAGWGKAPIWSAPSRSWCHRWRPSGPTAWSGSIPGSPISPCPRRCPRSGGGHRHRGVNRAPPTAAPSPRRSFPGRVGADRGRSGPLRPVPVTPRSMTRLAL